MWASFLSMVSDKNWSQRSNCKWTSEKLREAAKSLNEWLDRNIAEKKQFLLGDWAFESGYPNWLLAHYCEMSLDLDEAYQRAKAWQEHMISKGALYNKLNGKFAAMWLSNFHGWKTNESRLAEENVPRTIKLNVNYANGTGRARNPIQVRPAPLPDEHHRPSE